jgi:DNA-directed RNA polymerase beta' subunit
MESFFYNSAFDKGEIKRLIHWFLTNYGTPRTLKMVDELKTLGFHHATQAGISLGIEDLKIPPIKKLLVRNAEEEVRKNEERFSKGRVTAVERSQKIIDVWNTTSELLKEEVIQHFRKTDLLNPVYIMAFSGARGNISQVRQLVGMRGLMSDPQGEIIDLPIKSNFREGLTVTEYIISCYGARKGLVDTALKTANSGYLTRRLVDVAQAVIISEVDCNTLNGIQLSDLRKQKKILLSVEKRLVGRVLSENLLQNSNFIAFRGDVVCTQLAKKISQEVKTEISVRSPLTCQTRRDICQSCYGWSLAHGQIVDLGEAVGIIAAQSIGEPGTQLTMRTFHTGGVFATGVAERVYAPHYGYLRYDLDDGMKKVKTAYGQEAIYFQKETTVLIDQKKQKQTTLVFPPYTLIFVPPGELIYTKQIIAEFSSLEQIQLKPEKRPGIIATKEVFSTISGKVCFYNKKLKKQTKISTSTHFKKENQKKKIEASLTKMVRGNQLLSVSEGEIVSISSLQNPLARKGDFLNNFTLSPDKVKFTNRFKRDLAANPFDYSLESKTFAKGIIYTKSDHFLWVASSPKDYYFSKFFNILNFDLFSKWKLSKQANQTNKRFHSIYHQELSTEVQFDLMKKSSKLSVFSKLHQFKTKSIFFDYCFDEKLLHQSSTSSNFSLDESSVIDAFPTWSYLPAASLNSATLLVNSKSNLSLRKFKSKFALNYSLATPHTRFIDNIEFYESVYLEWFCVSKLVLVAFRKTVFFKKDKANQMVETALSIPANATLLRKARKHSLLASSFLPSIESNTATKRVEAKIPGRLAEIKTFNEEKQYLLINKTNKIHLNLNGLHPIVTANAFILKGSFIAPGLKSPESGIVIEVKKNQLVLQKASSYKASNFSLLSVADGNFVYEGKTLFHLKYKKEKTEDIVQGLPKVEELLEARKTKNLRPIPNNPHDRLAKQFANYKRDYHPETAIRKSLVEIQQFLVNGVQLVYQSQGVDISDKHIEIIVKQMTSKVLIQEAAGTAFLPGDLVELDILKKMNEAAIFRNHQLASYEPTILGITKASLKTESFLSAASFQETTRVLAQAAIQGKVDHFKGLKENVIIGRLIPAGTGFFTAKFADFLPERRTERETPPRHPDDVSQIIFDIDLTQ